MITVYSILIGHPVKTFDYYYYRTTPGYWPMRYWARQKSVEISKQYLSIANVSKKKRKLASKSDRGF